MWEDTVSAIQSADCETAAPLLTQVQTNDQLTPEQREAARYWKDNCFNYQRAREEVEAGNHYEAQFFYRYAIKPQEQEHLFYSVVAQQVSALYDTAPPKSLFSGFGCLGNVGETPAQPTPYYDQFYELGILNEAQHTQALIECSHQVVERAKKAPKYPLNSNILNTIYDTLATRLPQDEVAALKIQHMQHLQDLLEIVIADNDPTTMYRFFSSLEVLASDAEIHTRIADERVRLAYNDVLAKYDRAVNNGNGYWLQRESYEVVIEQIESFIVDYPDHLVADDAAMLLAQARFEFDELIASVPRTEITPFIINTPDTFSTATPQGRPTVRLVVSNPTPYETTIELSNPASQTYQVVVPACETCAVSDAYLVCSESNPTASIDIESGLYFITITSSAFNIRPGDEATFINVDSSFCIEVRNE